MPRRPTPVGLTLGCVLALGVSAGVGYAGGLFTGHQIANNNTTSPTDHIKAANATMAGKRGPRGLSAWVTIPSGGTVTGRFHDRGRSGASTGDVVETVKLPAEAPHAIREVAFAGGTGCSGTYSHPTAAPGHACVYLDSPVGLSNPFLATFDNAQRTLVWYLNFTESAANTDWEYQGSWAYTAP